MLVDIPGISCVKPMGALYLFPKIDTDMFGISDDRQFVLDLLKEKKILIVQGTGFNWPDPDHVRIVFLPREDELKKACENIRDFLLSRKGSV
jgi:alanine-synthesizing transaminase